jgi:phospholipase/carboxylesterase
MAGPTSCPASISVGVAAQHLKKLRKRPTPKTAQDRRAVAALAQCRSAAALHYRRSMPDWGPKPSRRRPKPNDQARRRQLRPHNGGKPAIWVIRCGYAPRQRPDRARTGAGAADARRGVYAPNAPQPCEGNPFGYQWFPVSRLDPALALAGARSAAPDVDAFLDEKMAEHGLDESKTCLVGFSQGTMMALHVGLRRAKPLAGIVGFSGMLAGPEVLKDEIKSRPPILLAHGDSDEMLPHVLSERAAEALRQNGVEVGVHIAEGVGHGINDTALSHAARFLLEAFKLPLPK